MHRRCGSIRRFSRDRGIRSCISTARTFSVSSWIPRWILCQAGRSSPQSLPPHFLPSIWMPALSFSRRSGPMDPRYSMCLDNNFLFPNRVMKLGRVQLRLTSYSCSSLSTKPVVCTTVTLALRHGFLAYRGIQPVGQIH